MLHFSSGGGRRHWLLPAVRFVDDSQSTTDLLFLFPPTNLELVPDERACGATDALDDITGIRALYPIQLSDPPGLLACVDPATNG